MGKNVSSKIRLKRKEAKKACSELTHSLSAYNAGFFLCFVVVVVVFFFLLQRKRLVYLTHTFKVCSIGTFSLKCFTNSGLANPYHINSLIKQLLL